MTKIYIYDKINKDINPNLLDALPNQIKDRVNKYKIIGEPLIRIVKETNNSKNIDFTSLMLFINEVEKQQVINNKKKIFN